MHPTKISAVIVTRNRLALLQECLVALRGQTRPADEIIVIDNASDDGTKEWLAGQQGIVTVRQANLGGAGGFYEGIKRACEGGHDWIWCMDDDTIPASNALEELLRANEKLVTAGRRAGFLCSKVLWTDGTLHKMNTPRMASDYFAVLELFPAGILPVVSCSFVSVLISREAVKAVGLPFKEMFIWYDDLEYTRRISARYECFQVLSSRVEHRTKTNYNLDWNQVAALPEKNVLWGIRNEVFVAGCQMRSMPGRLRMQIKTAMEIDKVVRKHAGGMKLARLRLRMLAGILFSPKIEFLNKAQVEKTGLSAP